MSDMRLDPILEQWLSYGPDQAPQHGLHRALAATRNARQQSRWEFPRTWLPAPVADLEVPRNAITLALVALILMLLIALAATFGGQLLRGPLVLGPTDEVIAFAEGQQLFVAEPDGSDRRKIDVGLPNASTPVFSPDGSHIAFLGSTSSADTGLALFVVAVDGSSPRLFDASHGMIVLPGKVPNFSWSSDSRRIAFSALDAGIARIFISDIAGSSLRPLTDGSKNSDLPSWSSVAVWGEYTGDWIAFRVTQPDRDEVSLERVHPDGSGLELMTAVIGSGSSLSRLSWSPPDPARPDKVEIAASYSMNLGFGTDTQAVIDLGITHQLPIWADGVGGLPDAPIPWSPDSRYLAFIAADRSVVLADDDRSSDLYDGEYINLGPVVDCWIEWSPNSQFLYGGAANDCAGIVVLPLANPAAATRLSNESGTASWRSVP